MRATVARRLESHVLPPLLLPASLGLWAQLLRPSSWNGRHCLCILEKAVAPHSSTPAWKIPWAEEPGKLQSMGSLRVGTRLSDFTLTFHFHALVKEMATHSGVLAWRIPGTGEPGGLWGLRGRTELDTTEVT